MERVIAEVACVESLPDVIVLVGDHVPAPNGPETVHRSVHRWCSKSEWFQWDFPRTSGRRPEADRARQKDLSASRGYESLYAAVESTSLNWKLIRYERSDRVGTTRAAARAFLSKSPAIRIPRTARSGSSSAISPM